MAYAETQARRAHALDAEIALAHHDLRKPVLAPAADHLCAETGLIPPTSAQGLGSPRPHLRRDWAHPAHICAGTGLASCRLRTPYGSQAAALWEQR